MTTAAILVAAGSGQRFGDAGKSFALTCGMPMAWWSINAASQATSVAEIVLVCGEHSRPAANALLEFVDSSKPVRLAVGGSRRQDSALAGIAATSRDVDIVVIHDAARPLVTADLFDRVVATARHHGAAIAATPASDTIKRVAGEVVVETLPRDELVSVQTPQAFNKTLLLNAFTQAEKTGLSVTDEAALIEACGLPVHVVFGEFDNLKVTYPSDLVMVEALLGVRQK